MLIWWSRPEIIMWDVNYDDTLHQWPLWSAQMTPWRLLNDKFHVFDHFRPPRLKTALAEHQNRKCHKKYCTLVKLHGVSFQNHQTLSSNSSWAPRSTSSNIFFLVSKKKYPSRNWPHPLKSVFIPTPHSPRSRYRAWYRHLGIPPRHTPGAAWCLGTVLAC